MVDTKQFAWAFSEIQLQPELFDGRSHSVKGAIARCGRIDCRIDCRSAA